MAIFDSILLGKSKGSVGNVTTSRLKGQNVAKAKITSTTNVNSAGQQLSRGKMSNIVLAWQFLAIFMVNATALRKSTESVYNAFVRGFKSGISEILAGSRPYAAELLSGIEGLVGNFITVNYASFAGTTAVFDLVTSGLPYTAGTFIRVISFISNSGEQIIVDRSITEVEWLSGSVSVLGLLAGSSNIGVYVYNHSVNKCSNVAFAGIA